MINEIPKDILLISLYDEYQKFTKNTLIELRNFEICISIQ